jgi:hypothetical protein
VLVLVLVSGAGAVGRQSNRAVLTAVFVVGRWSFARRKTGGTLMEVSGLKHVGSYKRNMRG